MTHNYDEFYQKVEIERLKERAKIEKAGHKAKLLRSIISDFKCAEDEIIEELKNSRKYYDKNLISGAQISLNTAVNLSAEMFEEHNWQCYFYSIVKIFHGMYLKDLDLVRQ